MSVQTIEIEVPIPQGDLNFCDHPDCTDAALYIEERPTASQDDLWCERHRAPKSEALTARWLYVSGEATWDETEPTEIDFSIQSVLECAPDWTTTPIQPDPQLYEYLARKFEEGCRAHWEAEAEERDERNAR